LFELILLAIMQATTSLLISVISMQLLHTMTFAFELGTALGVVKGASAFAINFSGLRCCGKSYFCIVAMLVQLAEQPA
jgi:hypothetical protein